MGVDFAKVKLIPIASVVARYKVETKRRSNTELIGQCPLPSHPIDSKHEWTLAISTEIGKAYCHNTRCREASNKPKGLDAIDFVCMMENVTNVVAAKRLTEMFAVDGNSHQPSKPLSSEKVEEGNKPLAFQLKHLEPDHPAIRERGLSLETIMEFGVGVQYGKGSMQNRICFPLHENGILIGYCGRTILPVTPENPKWRLPAGLHRTFLYGLEKCDPSKPLTLVESCWAVLHLFQHNVQSAALLGCCLTESQKLLLQPYAEIRICMDNDEAGRAAAQKIYERLKANHRVTKAFLKD
jgi:DNA primase